MDSAITTGTDHNASQIVLLGASNLTLAWPRIMHLVRSRFDGPIQVFTAHGMGRSYCGERSGFGMRRLPGILRSGLWDALSKHANDSAQPVALITDLGNDLVYGRSPTQVAAAAAESINRLRNWHSDCRVVITRPPTDAVNNLGSLRFLICKTVLFPFSSLQLRKIQDAANELDERLVDICNQFAVPLSRPDPGWYGMDPIHVKWNRQTLAFSRFMDLWPSNNMTRDTPLQNLTARPTAETRWIFGREQRTPQPVLTKGNVSIFAY